MGFQSTPRSFVSIPRICGGSPTVAVQLKEAAMLVARSSMASTRIFLVSFVSVRIVPPMTTFSGETLYACESPSPLRRSVRESTACSVGFTSLLTIL